MSIQDYISLLYNLYSTSLNIWGFLLTISIGIFAFLSASKNITINIVGILIILFLGFAYSNHVTLKHNFELRISIAETIESDLYQSVKENKASYDANKNIINKLALGGSDDRDSQKFRKLTFHVSLCFLIVAMMIFSIIIKRKK